MKGMILAAGFGTRFRPATFDIPKPMVPLCNRPLIDYACDSLLEAGVAEIVVNLHHLPDILEAHLERTLAGRCTVQFSHEREILGTGGGIRRVRSLLQSEESFLLVNGDTVQFPPLRALEAARQKDDALAAMLLRHAPEDDRFTPVFLEAGRITGFRTGTGEALMFAGAHAISRRIFDVLPDREFSGITEDVYIPLTRSGADVIAGITHDGPWFDIGTPRRYLEASHGVRTLMLRGEIAVPAGSEAEPTSGSIVAYDARIGDGEDLVAGQGSEVHRLATVRGSVLWSGCRVDEGAEVEDSILCDGVQVLRGVRISNALVCRRRELEYPAGTVFAHGLAAVPADPAKEMILS